MSRWRKRTGASRRFSEARARDGPADTYVVTVYLVFLSSPRYRLWKQRFAEGESDLWRSQKVHCEVKAEDDPADMDVGSRPLTMDGNWPGRSSEA
jgi:hypothetical protein